MKPSVDTTPIPKPANGETYIDAHGVERWADDDIIVSTGNAFRTGFGEPVNYYKMNESTLHSMRASKAIDTKYGKGINAGTIKGMSNSSDERLGEDPVDQSRWAVR